MNREGVRLWALLPCLWLAGCGVDDGRTLRTMVGDGNLPLTKMQPGELAEVRLVKSNDGVQKVLRLTLTETNKLEAQRERVSFKSDGRSISDRAVTVEAASAVTVQPDTAARIRERLAILRPTDLSADAPFVMPRNCGFIFHGSSKAVVEFVNKSRDRAGLFILQDGCEERTARRLTTELRSIVAALPRTKATDRFQW